jgi:hypothetical protein
MQRLFVLETNFMPKDEREQRIPCLFHLIIMPFMEQSQRFFPLWLRLFRNLYHRFHCKEEANIWEIQTKVHRME